MLTYTITNIIRPRGGNIVYYEASDRFGRTVKIEPDSIGVSWEVSSDVGYIWQSR
jgi:hypothetical protein